MQRDTQHSQSEKFWRVKIVSTLEHVKFQHGTTPDVKRSKRHLLARHTRCQWSMDTLEGPRSSLCTQVTYLAVKKWNRSIITGRDIFYKCIIPIIRKEYA